MRHWLKITCIAIIFSSISTTSGLAQYHNPAIDLPAGAGISGPGEGLQNNLLNGSSSYTIPLDLPPGTNGLAPQLSINYNSDDKNGPLGVGWKLSGLGLIKRSTKNGVPQYDSSDTFGFSLDGLSFDDLVYTGQEPSGSSGNYYQTKIHSFLRILYDTTGDYWMVTDKGGTHYRFGYNSDSRAVRPSGGTKAWYLDNITDSHNNSLNVSYINDQGTTYPSLITYTTGNGLSVFRTVEFIYEDRPDQRTDYSMGSKDVLNKRLHEIDIKVGGNLLRNYVLSYTQSPDTSQSLLNSVQLFGSDGTSALPPSTFGYTQLSHQLNSGIGWSNIDYSQGGISFSRTYTNGYCNVFNTMADMNGDGRLDRVTADSSNWQVYMNNGSGFNNAVSWSSPVGYAKRSYTSGDYTYLKVNLADMNGDGRADLVVAGSGNWQVSLNNGTGFDAPLSWPAPVDHISKSYAHEDNDVYRTYTYTSLMDMNGDGLPDLAAASSSNWQVYLNNGSGFNTTPLAWSNPDGIGYLEYSNVNTNTSNNLQQYTTAQTDDINGDGLPDLIVAGNPIKVYFNKGDGFDAFTNWANPTGLTYLSLRVYPPPGTYIGAGFFLKKSLLDINGDGRPDFISMGQAGGTRCCVESSGVTGRPEECANNMVVYINNGSGFAGSYTYSFPQALSVMSQDFYSHDSGTNTLIYANYASFTDINGDRLPDFVDVCCNESHPVFRNNSTIPDLLSHISNGKGGSFDVAYQPSTSYDNTGGDGKPDLPAVKYVLSSVTQNDGMNNSYTTNYTYSGGLYASQQKEFRGFRYVKVTDPSGAYKNFYFYQSDDLRGRIEYTEDKDSNNNLFLKTTNGYSTGQPYSGVFRVDLISQNSRTYDGGSAYKEAKIEFLAYDTYGNATQVKEHGDTSLSGDERYACSEYAYNTSLYIVNRVAHAYTKAFDNTTKVSETWNYYDGATTPGAPPTKGDVTKVERWLSGGTNPVISYTYDIFGNRTSTTDARGHTSSTTYDSTYYTYPVTETDAKSHVTNKTYDALGRLISRTDPNNSTISYGYDVFSRMITEIHPYDSQNLPTVTYEYYEDGVAPEYQVIKRRGATGSAYTFDTYALKDGFGREIQTKKWAEDTSRMINVTTQYDGRNLVISRTNPHSANASTNYTPPTGVPSTQYSYDALRRITGITNPDNTQRTTTYAPWVVTNIDENGHKRALTNDAYGRLIKAEEYAGSAVYATTAYTYDTLGNLVRIVDNSANTTLITYDTLGRKISLTDPDMGAWSYVYDANGNLIKQTDARGKIIEFTYDQLNRLTGKEYK